jgi:Ser/Thr protein kinase RdoA (MazF antagonist)
MVADPPGVTPDPAVLAAFELASAPLQPAGAGLINRTWHVRTARGEPCVLQRVNEIFPAEIHFDIAAVTEHLAAKGLVTPRLVRTRAGELWLQRDGAVWRVLTAIDGVTYDAIESPQHAREAGRVLGEFHRAVADLDHAFTGSRLGVHDTARHIAALRRALAESASHAEIERVRPLAEQVLSLAARLPPLRTGTDRIVHGDPKISNIVYARGGVPRALCLIDLDTLARMPVVLELGDALRSWCNPRPEDDARASFSVPLAAAAMEGYAAAVGQLLDPAEWREIPAAAATIAVELAARFCRDSLEERYFAWDRSRYRSASAHHQARARGQLRVAEAILDELPALGALAIPASRA